ncbi:MAG: hypothetical protein ACRBBS_09675 [Thalassovita sp.]
MAKTSDDRHELICHMQRSIRYHRARERFFDSWSNAFSFLSLLSGSAVVVSLLSKSDEWVSLTAGALVAISQALELVGRISAKARLHNGLAGEFLALERSMVRRCDEATNDLSEIWSEILLIEAREPPVKRYLDLICHNQVALALGIDDTEKLSWFQRTFAQYLDGDSALAK